tara:strand:- start:162 stop:440 length:279 start_codon:yes stop_codon:yes gene_type:complete
MAKYRGRTVKLNKPFRTPNQRKKFAVYVKNKLTGNIKKVRFGDPNMSIKKNNPARQRSFMARHGAILRKVTGQKNLKPVFWAIKSWRKGFKI